MNCKSFSQKAELITELETVDDDRVVPIMRQMLEGNLYYRKDSAELVFAAKVDDGFKPLVFGVKVKTININHGSFYSDPKYLFCHWSYPRKVDTLVKRIAHNNYPQTGSVICNPEKNVVVYDCKILQYTQKDHYKLLIWFYSLLHR